MRIWRASSIANWGASLIVWHSQIEPSRHGIECVQGELRMYGMTRRNFLQSAATMVAGAAALRSGSMLAAPLGLPIGLQLYSVRDMIAKDYEGTLKQVAALGYQEVEAAGYYGHTAQQVRQAMRGAGLRLVSAHYSLPELNQDLEQTIAFNKEVGVETIICSFPGIKYPTRLKDKSFQTIVQSFTMEDYHWNAEQFNHIGEKVKAAGMRFGYHNHTMEFGKQDGVIPFDELIRRTDPALVTFEMDCGWVTVGGGDPVHYLKMYPTRISMLHIKDFKPTAKPASVIAPPPAAELGTGTVNFRAIFAAAIRTNIKHYFVEQEGFDMPPLQALQIDADYMKHLSV
jgi:sugar phosphate isomerase/epimerase